MFETCLINKRSATARNTNPDRNVRGAKGGPRLKRLSKKQREKRWSPAGQNFPDRPGQSHRSSRDQCRPRQTSRQFQTGPVHRWPTNAATRTKSLRRQGAFDNPSQEGHVECPGHDAAETEHRYQGGQVPDVRSPHHTQWCG